VCLVITRETTLPAPSISTKSHTALVSLIMFSCPETTPCDDGDRSVNKHVEPSIGNQSNLAAGSANGRDTVRRSRQPTSTTASTMPTTAPVATGGAPHEGLRQQVPPPAGRDPDVTSNQAKKNRGTRPRFRTSSNATAYRCTVICGIRSSNVRPLPFSPIACIFHSPPWRYSLAMIWAECEPVTDRLKRATSFWLVASIRRQ